MGLLTPEVVMVPKIPCIQTAKPIGLTTPQSAWEEVEEVASFLLRLRFVLETYWSMAGRAASRDCLRHGPCCCHMEMPIILSPDLVVSARAAALDWLKRSVAETFGPIVVQLLRPEHQGRTAVWPNMFARTRSLFYIDRRRCVQGIMM